jgi:hypothetical protein
MGASGAKTKYFLCFPILNTRSASPSASIRMELNSTFVLSDANAAPPPPASTPPSGIAPFSTTATIQLSVATIVAISTQGSIRKTNQIHTRTSR